MEFIKKELDFIKKEDKCFISIGNKCETALILKKLNLRDFSLPFDFIPSLPHLVLKYLQSTNDYFPKKNETLNIDGLWFGHFVSKNDTQEYYDDFVKKFNRRWKRLFDLLNDDKSDIVFVYTSLADIYNEMKARDRANYASLIKLTAYLAHNYPCKFRIVCFHTNKVYQDTKHITNYTIKVDEKNYDQEQNRVLNQEYADVIESILLEILI